MELILLLLTIVVVSDILSSLGKAALVDWLHPVVLRFSNSAYSTKSRAFKADILKLKAELSATSSQDEFAKWAKIRRKLDKTIADHDELTASQASAKAALAKQVGALFFVLTTAVPYALTFYHRKSPVFYLPATSTWFPARVGWALSLPSAPTGAVAVGVWSWACRGTLASVKEVGRELFAKDPVPVAVPGQPAAATEKGPAASTTGKEKKEL